ncbi:hypothetical protein K470DRAFT_116175 [Piedraia hortae CBS 480.64]|uniref:Uncharacterized protein n=1 Tax=Piedraia hortae CBS 480.64 TaxID=1314780 RepID=A0A6A7BUB6_9PEZI|nr:hypothetical protein K470DRAFT_116175 [Piedraia hortae CBS 480.64]
MGGVREGSGDWGQDVLLVWVETYSRGFDWHCVCGHHQVPDRGHELVPVLEKCIWHMRTNYKKAVFSISHVWYRRSNASYAAIRQGDAEQVQAQDANATKPLAR